MKRHLDDVANDLTNRSHDRIRYTKKGLVHIYGLWKTENYWVVIFEIMNLCNTVVLTYWVKILIVKSFKSRSSIFEN